MTIEVPNTITDLIERIEQGDDPTPEELRRIQRLQSLYIVKAGEDYLRESLDREQAADQQLEQGAGA